MNMTWQIDPGHSSVSFSARHMMLTKVRGEFEKFSGSVDFNEANPAASSVDVTIDTSSINTKQDQRDGHLKSPDFLDVENNPTITFKSTKVEVVNDTTGKIYGELTIRGVSKEVVLDTEFNGIAKSPWGTESAGFSATTKINRKDWGLNWNVALETGGWLVGEEITIDIEIEVVKQAEQAAEEPVAA
jgi:polyisoprenoid-binding protein YceI